MSDVPPTVVAVCDCRFQECERKGAICSRFKGREAKTGHAIVELTATCPVAGRRLTRDEYCLLVEERQKAKGGEPGRTW